MFSLKWWGNVYTVERKATETLMIALKRSTHLFASSHRPRVVMPGKVKENDGRRGHKKMDAIH